VLIEERIRSGESLFPKVAPEEKNRWTWRLPPHNLCASLLSAERSIAPAVPARLAAIGMKAMAGEPEDRDPRCADLADDLRRWSRAGRE
jgi:hypothetical protein